MSTLGFVIGEEFHLPDSHPLVSVEIEIEFIDGALVRRLGHDFFKAVGVKRVRHVAGDMYGEVTLMDLFWLQSEHLETPDYTLRDYEQRLCQTLNES